MRFKAVLRFGYGSASEAKAVAAALEPDNEGFVRTAIKGKVLEARAEAGTAEALRHTLDDFLACLRVAEDAVGIRTAGAGDKGKEEGDEDE